jgi:hypothetical protein
MSDRHLTCKAMNRHSTEDAKIREDLEGQGFSNDEIEAALRNVQQIRAQGSVKEVGGILRRPVSERHRLTEAERAARRARNRVRRQRRLQRRRTKHGRQH